MARSTFLLLILFSLLGSCGNIVQYISPSYIESNTKQIKGLRVLSYPTLNIVNADFPLYLSKIDFQDLKKIEHFNDRIENKIRKTLSDIYIDEYGEVQKFYSIRNIYIGTVRLRDCAQSIFMIIYKPFSGFVSSQVLFYDMDSKEFADSTLDFNIFALYHGCQDGKLVPGNLKDHFKINSPEIELVDFGKDGKMDYKFTRLYHNGTANAIETTILKVSKNKIDTLYFNQDFISSLNH